MMTKKLFAEAIGTAWLVFGGCGSAVLAAAFTTGAPHNIHLGIGFVGVSLDLPMKPLTEHRIRALRAVWGFPLLTSYTLRPQQGANHAT